MARLEDHGTTGGERADAVDHCLAGIARLSNEVNDASSFIPAYDQRTYSEAIKALSNKLQAVRSRFAPRPKFSFKSPAFTAHKNESAISLNDAAELASQKRLAAGAADQLSGDTSGASSFAPTPAGLRSPNTEPAGASPGRDEGQTKPSSSAVNISNRAGELVTLPPASTQAASSATLSGLKRCLIDLSPPSTSTPPLATLTLKNISHSLILCPDLAGPAHLTDVSQCVVAVGCRQFRMHDSARCDVYLHCSSRPIIEACSGVRFAPLPETLLADKQRGAENLWGRIDDFKWLRAEPSPNWSVLEDGQRVSEEVWRKVGIDGQKGKTEEVLAMVGLSS